MIKKNIYLILIIILILINEYVIFKAQEDAKQKSEYQEKKECIDQQEPPLIKAIINNDIRLVKKLLRENNNINAESYLGLTALMWAASEGNNEIVRELISAGANVNAMGDNEITALHKAVIHNYYDIAIELINAGANVNAKDSKGDSILHYAAEASNPDIRILKLLLEKGVLINERNNEGYTPLAVAVKSNTVFNNNEDFIKELIKAGSDVNATDEYGESILMISCCCSFSKEITKMLIKNGANINAKNNQGGTALFYAIKHNNLEKVKLLIEAGANINESLSDGTTPIVYAFEERNIDMAKFLLKNGAILPAGHKYALDNTMNNGPEEPYGDRFFQCQNSSAKGGCIHIDGVEIRCSMEIQKENCGLDCVIEEIFIKKDNQKILLKEPRDLKGCVEIKSGEGALEYLRFFSSGRTIDLFDDKKLEIYLKDDMDCNVCLPRDVWLKYKLHEPKINPLGNGFEVSRIVIIPASAYSNQANLYEIKELVTIDGDVFLISKEKINADAEIIDKYLSFIIY